MGIQNTPSIHPFKVVSSLSVITKTSSYIETQEFIEWHCGNLHVTHMTRMIHRLLDVIRQRMWHIQTKLHFFYSGSTASKLHLTLITKPLSEELKKKTVHAISKYTAYYLRLASLSIYMLALSEHVLSLMSTPDINSFISSSPCHTFI